MIVGTLCEIYTYVAELLRLKSKDIYLCLSHMNLDAATQQGPVYFRVQKQYEITKYVHSQLYNSFESFAES